MSRHLVIMAAGTGGHIIPGLAVAHEMQQRGWTVSWLGTSHGMENQLVPPSGIPMDTVQFSGLRGKGLKHSLQGVTKLFKAFGACTNILRQRQADAVLGMGGYVCFPGGLMAALQRKALVLVNADASLLMSNKLLLPVASRIAFGFDGEMAARVRRAVVTGNPVRADIEAMPEPSKRFVGRDGPLRVLVVGGSLGAQAINTAVPQALALIAAEHRPIVTHQTGAKNLEAVKAAYALAGIEAEVLPFIDDMAERLAGCDLMIGRAGAVTVSELCAGGVASVLVPLVVSTTAHQRDNAKFMAQHGAAVHLPQREMSAQKLAELLRGFDRVQLEVMAEKARHLGRPRAAARVADEIEAVARRKEGAE
jgi:UDP-N-acetylglucosamine--N-acetylmuramyl-(pentapeptide) pyrophosphoryl-undecaprenol N-acetylglucosamine transferase